MTKLLAYVPLTVAVSLLTVKVAGVNLRETVLAAWKLASRLSACCLGIEGQSALIALMSLLPNARDKSSMTLLIANFGSSVGITAGVDDGCTAGVAIAFGGGGGAELRISLMRVTYCCASAECWPFKNGCN